MARTPKQPVSAAPIVEQIPSVQGGLSAVASAGAPIIFLDGVSNSGHYNGIAHLTLEALRFMAVNETAVSDRVIVAHLRMNLVALAALKAAIETIERGVRQAAGVPEH